MGRSRVCGYMGNVNGGRSLTAREVRRILSALGHLTPDEQQQLVAWLEHRRGIGARKRA